MLCFDVGFTYVGILCPVGPPEESQCDDGLCAQPNKAAIGGVMPRWRTPPSVVFHWKRLEDQYVVYNSGSGHTHVLDPVAALLVQQLTERCCDTAELVQRIAALLNLEATEEFSSELQQTLSELDELGMIEPLIP